MKTLHWPPVRARIEFKICVLVHNIVHGGAPQYMKDMVNFKEKSSRFVRSDNKKYILDVPFTRRKTFRDRAFSKAGPLLWNSLLEELRVIENTEVFKKKLKTYLFKKCYY